MALYFYGTRMELIRQITTDLFILFIGNQGKRKSDPLSSARSVSSVWHRNRTQPDLKPIKNKHPAVEMYCLNNYYIRANTSRCQLCFSNPRQTFGCPGSGEQRPRLRGAVSSPEPRNMLCNTLINSVLKR